LEMQTTHDSEFTRITDPQQGYPAALGTKVKPMLIAAGSEMSGAISALGDILIYGYVQGEITAHDGQVFIMNSGRVDGTVLAGSVLVAGHLNGSCATDSLVVRSTGVVEGMVKSARLALEQGGMLLGISEHCAPQSDRTWPTLDDQDGPASTPYALLDSPDAELEQICIDDNGTAPWLPPSWVSPLRLAGVAIMVGGVTLWATSGTQQHPASSDEAAAPVVRANTSSSAPAAMQQASTVPSSTVEPTKTTPLASKPAVTMVAKAATPPVPTHAELTKATPVKAVAPIEVPKIQASKALATKGGSSTTVAPLLPAQQTSVAALPQPQASAPRAQRPMDDSSKSTSVRTQDTATASAEGKWLADLSTWQGKELNLLIKASTRTRNSNQKSPLKNLIAQTAQHMMLTRKLQKKYAPQRTLAPYIPDPSVAVASSLSDQEIKQQYQQKLNAMLAQADSSSFHPDSQQLIATLRQAASL
jgi:cytoskeletal protein CcmA (bactofilin family)